MTQGVSRNYPVNIHQVNRQIGHAVSLVIGRAVISWKPFSFGALVIEFPDGRLLFSETPVSYLFLICADRTTLELPIHTMSLVCPTRRRNSTLKSEPEKINKLKPHQKCCSPFGRLSQRRDDPP